MTTAIKNQQEKKHRGGRPRVNDPRAFTISTKVNSQEKALIDSKIKMSGLRNSEAIRVLLLNDKLPDSYYRGLNPFAVKGYQNLQPLQSNLNQIAHHLNQYAAAGARLNNDKLTKIVVQTAKHTRAVEQLVRHFRHELLTKGGSRVSA